MANKCKNNKTRRLQKMIDALTKAEITKGVLSKMVGKEIVMSDRTYVVLPNGSYKRVQNKQDIRYSSKRQKVIDRIGD